MRNKLLILVILIAAAFRFISLGHNPPALNWDEIAIGWNAYSLLHTGKDEFGEFLPLTFRSFDDYKSPAYIYAVVPSIALFGKTEFAIRFPSAFTGTLTVLILYFLVRELLYKKIQDEHLHQIWINRTANVALFTAGILAITPWHVHFSRVAFEANFALFWEILGAYLFLKWINSPDHTEKTRFKLLLFSAISFGIALYSYANARLFVILLLLGWAVYLHKTLLQRKKELAGTIIIGLIISFPLILQMAQGVGLARFSATSIFSRPEIYLDNKRQAVEDYHKGQGRFSVIIHNVRVPVIKQIIQNYLDHYAYFFLFVKSDLPRHQVPGFGLLFPWQLPLILIGIVFLIKQYKSIDPFLPLWWLFIAPIPAAFTWQVPHSIRSELMLPMLTVLTGIGLWVVLKFLQQIDLLSYTRKVTGFVWLWPKVAFVVLIAGIGVSALSLAVSYQTNLPLEFGKQWLYGRKEMVEFVEIEKDQYDRIVVDMAIEWAYLWFAWYGDYTPEEYLDQGGTISGGFQDERNRLGKIEFRRFDFNPTYFGSEKGTPNTLYIGTAEQFPTNLVPYKRITDLSGKPMIYIVKS